MIRIHAYFLLLSASAICSNSKTFVLNIHTWAWVKVNDVKTIVFRTPPSAPSKPWTVTDSLLTCILRCRSVSKDCSTIKFNRKTSNCTVGVRLARLHLQTSPINETETVVYTRSGICEGKFVYNFMTRLCTYSSTTRMNFTQAEDQCRSDGGSLFSIKNSSRIPVTIYSPGEPVFIGLHKTQYLNLVSDYKWSDGSTFTSTKDALMWTSVWLTGQPDDLEMCVLLGTDAKLRSVGCGQEHNFLCEMPMEG